MELDLYRFPYDTARESERPGHNTGALDLYTTAQIRALFRHRIDGTDGCVGGAL
jgi:hypothetical protein